MELKYKLRISSLGIRQASGIRRTFPTMTDGKQTFFSRYLNVQHDRKAAQVPGDLRTIAPCSELALRKSGRMEGRPSGRA